MILKSSYVYHKISNPLTLVACACLQVIKNVISGKSEINDELNYLFLLLDKSKLDFYVNVFRKVLDPKICYYCLYKKFFSIDSINLKGLINDYTCSCESFFIDEMNECSLFFLLSTERFFDILMILLNENHKRSVKIHFLTQISSEWFNYLTSNKFNSILYCKIN